MWLIYLISIIPAVVGGVLWLKNKEVHLAEWLGGSAIGFVVSGIFHYCVISSMISDTETWSGKVSSIVFHPYWHASWIEIVTHGAGSDSYTTIEHREESHQEYWEAFVNFGERDESHRIDKNYFNQILNEFGGKQIPKPGHRPDFDRGDRNDYFAYCGQALVPAHTAVSFENRVKAAPSLFSYSPPPKEWGFQYPECGRWNQSNRLVGAANNSIPIRKWDELNARLGPSCFVNLILVDFGDSDENDGHLLEAKWLGGKKNDLVLCRGLAGNVPWSYTFGWTESDLVKQNLQSILIENKLDTSIIPKIEDEVRQNYKLKDWSKFDYITINPPGWVYPILILIMVLTQTGFWIFAIKNDLRNNSFETPFTRMRS